MRTVSILLIALLNFPFCLSCKCKTVVLDSHIPPQEQIIHSGTKYIVNSDFNLQGSSLMFPESCTLQVKKGVFSNGKLVGKKTTIIGSKSKHFCTDVAFSGTWKSDVIHISWFGLIKDGNSNNAQQIAVLNSLLKAHESANVSFEKGEYLTTGTLISESCKNLTIIGKQAKIIKVNNTWMGDNIALYIKNADSFKLKGLTIDMQIKDKMQPTDVAYRYYAIWVRMDENPCKKVEIENCRFIDNMSVPNSKVKPYNGTLWIGSYETKGENITIRDNVFENSCGRVIYLTNSSNILIENNKILNASHLDYDSQHINQELICFRSIGCQNVRIIRNRLIMSKTPVRFASQKIFEINCNDLNFEPVKDVLIEDNYIDCSPANVKVSCIAFHLKCGKDITARRNTILMNDHNKSYLVYYNHSERDQISNMVFEANKFHNIYDKSITIWGSTPQMMLLFKNNKFYSINSFKYFNTGGDMQLHKYIYFDNNLLYVNSLINRNINNHIPQ